MLHIRLRTAIFSDLDELFALYQAEQWTNFSRKKIESMILAPASHYLVLEQNGEILAFIRYLTDEVETTFIGELIVSKNYRKQGFGRRLIEEVAARHPETRMELVSEQDDFYRKLGFVEIGNALRLRR